MIAFEEALRENLVEDKKRFKDLEPKAHKLLRFYEKNAPKLAKLASPHSPIEVAAARLCTSQFECLESIGILSRAGKAACMPNLVRRMFESHVALLAIAFPINPKYSRSTMAWRFIAHGQRQSWRQLGYLRKNARREGEDPNDIIDPVEWRKACQRAARAKSRFKIKSPTAAWHPYGTFDKLFEAVKTGAQLGQIPSDAYYFDNDKAEFEKHVFWQFTSSYVHGDWQAINTWINIDCPEDQFLQLNYAHGSGMFIAGFVLAGMSLSAFAHCVDGQSVLREFACKEFGVSLEEYDSFGRR